MGWTNAFRPTSGGIRQIYGWALAGVANFNLAFATFCADLLGSGGCLSTYTVASPGLARSRHNLAISANTSPKPTTSGAMLASTVLIFHIACTRQPELGQHPPTKSSLLHGEEMPDRRTSLPRYWRPQIWKCNRAGSCAGCE